MASAFLPIPPIIWMSLPLFDDHPDCKFDNSEISAVDLGVLVLSRRLSSRLGQRVCDRTIWNLMTSFMSSFICGSEPTSSPVATRSPASMAAPTWNTWLASSTALLTLCFSPRLVFALATAPRTACEGVLPVETKEERQSVQTTTAVMGQAVAVVCDRVSTWTRRVLWRIIQELNGKGKRKEKKTGRNAASAGAAVPPAPTS